MRLPLLFSLSIFRSLLLPLLALAAFVFSPSIFAADHDFLHQETVRYRSADPERTLRMTADRLGDLFERYVPELGRRGRIVSPKTVSGPNSNPVLQMTIHKCVFVICKTVALDADIAIREVPGRCQRNMLLTADLARSGSVLTHYYDSLDVSICLNHLSPPGNQAWETAELVIEAGARRSRTYATGPVQQADQDLLKTQVHPMIQALTEALIAQGAKIP